MRSLSITPTSIVSKIHFDFISARWIGIIIDLPLISLIYTCLSPVSLTISAILDMRQLSHRYERFVALVFSEIRQSSLLPCFALTYLFLYSLSSTKLSEFPDDSPQLYHERGDTSKSFLSSSLSLVFLPRGLGTWVAIKFKLLSFSIYFIYVWQHSPLRSFPLLFPFPISILRSFFAFFFSLSISVWSRNLAAFRIFRSLFPQNSNIPFVTRACIRSSVRGSKSDFSSA
ncbi:unnamed protein product [Acanthosepion pharaonis]|uniref:Uncharacterized protein n=1 Tax=Acanthosepion pharaonis TaxID=158019 RepID=A0A812B5P9_ACAPH|nr:unnamed protein product [Sepia pharaonis]